MGAIAFQITNPTIVYSIVYSDADQRKHQSSASLAFTGDLWIPCTNGQLRGKCFHLMTSSWITGTHQPLVSRHLPFNLIRRPSVWSVTEVGKQVSSHPHHRYWNAIAPETLAISWYHDGVIKWKHFPRYWPFVRGIHRSPVNSPHKGQWRGALMFSLICTWINGWVNNREAGDLRRNRAHYDVIVMAFRPCCM